MDMTDKEARAYLKRLFANLVIEYYDESIALGYSAEESVHRTIDWLVPEISNQEIERLTNAN